MREDIVSELRRFARWMHPDLLNGAADEIERLRSELETERGHRQADNEDSRVEIERLRAALSEVQEARIDAAVEGSEYKAKWNACRALLREACFRWEESRSGVGDTKLAAVLDRVWYERAKKEVGGE